MRILALVTAGFGGHGGIAKFNRDLLTALALHPECSELVAFPRVMAEDAGALPPRLSWRVDGLGGRFRYSRAVMRLALGARGGPGEGQGPAGAGGRGFDLILCGHINLVPVAWLACWVAGPRGRAGAGIGRNGDGSKAKGSYPPLVLIIHGIEAWRPRCRRRGDFLLSRIDAVVSVSDLTWRRFAGWAPVKNKPSYVLPNCADLAHFRPGPKSDSLMDRYGLRGRPVLMTVARLRAGERYKGIDEVLALMPSLVGEVPELCYVIGGEGTDRRRLMAKARWLGLSVRDMGSLRAERGSGGVGTAGWNVVFTGHIVEEEKADHYRLADAFVMPGWGEGFGIVYLEALACGIPVVGSKLDASREVLEGCESAFLVDPREPEEIREGIQSALGCPRGRVPAWVRSFSEENFSEQARRLLDELRKQFGV